MKKGLAVEGFIREDGTVGPLQTYDDTELRGKIQKNVDEIDNLKSSVSDLTDRVEDIEEHGGGGVDVSSKADKAEGAVEGNFAGLDGEGNLTDSGKKAADFAEANHEHFKVGTGLARVFAFGNSGNECIQLFLGHENTINSQDSYNKLVTINRTGIEYLKHLLTYGVTGAAIPGSDSLATSAAVASAVTLANTKMDDLPVVSILTISNVLNATNYALVDSSDFTEGSFGYLPITKRAILRVSGGSPTAPEEASMLCSIIYKYDAEEGEIDMSIYAGGHLLQGTYDINDTPAYLELTKSTHDLLA